MSITKLDRSRDTMVAPEERKTLGIAALAALGLVVATISLETPESPEAGRASAQEIRQFAADNTDVMQFSVGGSLVYIAAFTVFAAALIELVRGRRPRSVASGVIAICAAVSLVDFILLLSVTVPFAFPDELDKVSDSTVVSWWNLLALAETSQFINNVVTHTVLIVAFSVVALRTRLMARWVCWLGLVIAFAGLWQVPAMLLHIHADAINHTFLIAILGWFLWPLFVGGALGVRWFRTRRPRDLTSYAAAPAAE